MPKPIPNPSIKAEQQRQQLRIANKKQSANFLSFFFFFSSSFSSFLSLFSLSFLNLKKKLNRLIYLIHFYVCKSQIHLIIILI